MMQVEECYLKGSESVELYGKLYIPDDSLNALLIIVHGIGQHSGCYNEWAEKFALQSIGVFTFDLRGHGRSSGKRGHTTINLIKDDIRVIINDMTLRFPDVPIVLFGNSMGGQIALSYAVDQNDGIQGVVASSPWLKLVNPPSRLLVKTAKLAARFVPGLTVRTGIKADQLSQGGGGTKSAKKDPLLHKRISVKLFSDLYANGEALLRGKNQLDIPFLLMHGTSDTLVSFKASKLFAERNRKNRKIITFRKWQKMRHDLLNDSSKDMVYRFVIFWLSKNVFRRWNYSEQS